MNAAYRETVRAADEANGEIPIFVGAMDNSIVKVAERIQMIGNGKNEGVVLTTPFYTMVTNEQMVNWFSSIATKSPYPVYLYDLPLVTKCKITMSVIEKLIMHPNIKGIKTADWEMIQTIGRKYSDSNFSCFYSGLDSFDYANIMGIGKNLDGMFCRTPQNAKKMFDCLGKEDYKGARDFLDNILLLRNTMLACDLVLSFTYCMNTLGFAGNFHQDYCLPITDTAKTELTETMKKIGEI